MPLWCSWCARLPEEQKDAVRFRGEGPLSLRTLTFLLTRKSVGCCGALAGSNGDLCQQIAYIDALKDNGYNSVAQWVEREPALGEGPNAAGKTKPMVRVHPELPNISARALCDGVSQ